MNTKKKFHSVMMATLFIMLLSFGFVCKIEAAIIDARTSYSAVADGVTDDRTAIQNAINAANAGDTVRLRNDSSNNWAGFGIGSPLYMKAGVILEGYGGGYHLKALNSSAAYKMLSLNNNVTLTGLRIDGVNKARIGVWVNSNLSNIMIQDCLIANLKAQTSTSGYARGISISDGCSNVTIETTTIQGISGGDNGIVADIYGANRGIYIGEVTDTLVDDCDIKWIYSYEDGDGIQVQTTPDANGVYPDSGVTINNCRFLDCIKSGVKLMASGVSVTDCTITGTKTYDPGHYAGIRSEAGDYNYINGNTITLERSLFGIQISNSYNTVVQYNDVSIEGSYSQARGSDIRAMRLLQNCNQVTVKENTFYSPNKGIHLYDYDGTCSYNYISYNTIDIVATGGYHVYGNTSNSIHHNTELTH